MIRIFILLSNIQCHEENELVKHEAIKLMDNVSDNRKSWELIVKQN